MDLLAGWDDGRCEDTIAGRQVLLIGYTMPMVDFTYAFQRANLYLQPESVIADNLTRVAKREANIWIESMKKELAGVYRPMEVFLAACFLMCRHMEAQSDHFASGDLRRRFYNEVHDALVDHNTLAGELRKGTKVLEQQCRSWGDDDTEQGS